MLRSFLVTSAVFIFALHTVTSQPIEQITFEGLKKTKESYLQKVLESFYGSEADEETLHKIETALQAEGIFETIKVQPIEEGLINISVKEKITFIPLPFVTVSNGKWMGGGMLLNMNAFGNKTTLVTGGFVSSTMFMGMLLLSKPAAGKDGWGWTVYAGASKNLNEYTDIQDRDFLKLRQNTGDISTSLSKKLSDFTTVSFGIGTTIKKMEEEDGWLLPVDKDNRTSFIVKAQTSLSHGKNDWNGWYLNSKTAYLNAEKDYNLHANKDFTKLNASIMFQQELTKRLRFASAVAGEYNTASDITLWGSGMSAAVTILPPNFASAELIGTNAGLELAVKKFKFGILSLYSNYQICTAKDVDKEFNLNHGISGGTRLYLSKIAFPAFAIVVSKNFSTNKVYWNGSLGISY